jgi:hypothetical protein
MSYYLIAELINNFYLLFTMSPAPILRQGFGWQSLRPSALNKPYSPEIC